MCKGGLCEYTADWERVLVSVLPGICLAQPMLTTSSLSARSHSVVRALMSLSGTVGSGMAKMPSGSATSSKDTTLFSTAPPTVTERDGVKLEFCYHVLQQPLYQGLFLQPFDTPSIYCMWMFHLDGNNYLQSSFNAWLSRDTGFS